MTATQANARDVAFQIEDPASPGTWVPIAPKGIETFTKSTDYEAVDTTTFGSEGQAETQNNQISKSLKLEGKRLLDPDTGALDPGQALVEALSEGLSDASLGSIRFAHVSETEWEVWTATAQMGDVGGGNNDKISWSVTFARSGASTTAAKS